jgi:hypothetical protein
MALRWAAAGMLAAAAQFRRVKGYQGDSRRARTHGPEKSGGCSTWLSVRDRRVSMEPPTKIQRRAGHPLAGSCTSQNTGSPWWWKVPATMTPGRCVPGPRQSFKSLAAFGSASAPVTCASESQGGS